MKHLNYCGYESFYCGENRHPQLVMKELGITYLMATPQSLGDRWLFWCCDNLPEKLPKFLTEWTESPTGAIGHGLTAADAAYIIEQSEAHDHSAEL